MNRKILSALIVSAFASIATTASAGVIQASYKNYAAEVFGDPTVVLTAPTVNYALALPLSGTAGNPNTFSISWTLDQGQWAAAPAAATIQLLDPTSSAHADSTPTAVTLSSDKKTITATFTVTTNYTTGSQIVLGTGGAVNVTNVATILGAPTLNPCGNDVASIGVTVKLTNAAGAEFESNFTSAPLSNTTPIVQSKLALSVTPLASSAFSPTGETSAVDVLQPSLGTLFTNPAGDVTNSTTVINLGQVVIADKTTGLSDLSGAATPYSVTNAAWATNPNTFVGVVEANTLTINLTGNFVAGGTITAADTADLAGAATFGTGVIAADGKSATLSLSNAELASLTLDAANHRSVNIIYTAPGNKLIPTSQFKVTGGTLTKFANSFEAPNSVCPGNLYNLGTNGVRIDVRNYIPGVAKAPSGGWFSVIRVINTDDTLSASPVVQALLADGTLGSSASLANVKDVAGKTGALAPLEVRYYFNTDIDAALNAAAGAGAPTYGAADIPGNARLRITAPVSSLRVQNYQFNPATGNFLEASNAQGDDGPDYNRAADRDNK